MTIIEALKSEINCRLSHFELNRWMYWDKEFNLWVVREKVENNIIQPSKVIFESPNEEQAVSELLKD